MAETSESGSAEKVDHYDLPRDTLLVTGPDRKAWLDGLVTCAVASVAPGAGAYGLLLTKQGKIVTDLFLVDDGQRLFVGVAPGKGAEVRELLDRYLVMEDAELAEARPSPVWRFIVGAPGSSPGLAALGALSLAGLSGTVGVVASSSDLPVAASAEALAALWARHGLGRFGVDFGERDNPHEASLDRVAISWSKGCYLGQEVVCMQDMRGKVKRRLVALEASEAAPVTGSIGKSVMEEVGSAVAGQVTSVHELPKSSVFLASVATPALESQAPLSVDGHRVRLLERAVSPST